MRFWYLVEMCKVSLTFCPLGNFHAFLPSADFFQSKLFRKIFQEYHLSVKKIRSRSGPTFCRALIWVQSVCKGHEQTTLVGNEFNVHVQLLSVASGPILA